MKKNIIIIIKLFVSLGLITFLFSKFNFKNVINNFESLNIFYLLLSLATIFAAWFVSSKKWQMLIGHLGFEHSVGELFKLNLISLFYATVLPGGQVTGETFKCIKISKGEKSKSKLVFSVLFDKLIGLIAFVIIGFIGLLFSNSDFELKTKMLAVFFVGLLVSASIVFLVNEKISDAVYRAFKKFSKKEGSFYVVFKKITSLLFLYKGAYAVIVLAIIYGVVFQFLNCLSIFFIAKSLNMFIPLLDIMWVMALVSIILVVPVTILGLGLREGSFIVLLGFLGFNSETSLSLSLLLTSVLIFVGLLGGVFEIFDSFFERRNKKETSNDVKKIFMIVPTSFFAHRGCHIRILEEVKALTKNDYKIKIATYHVGDDIDGLDIERIIKIPWYNKIESGPSWHKIYLDFFLLLKSIRIMLSYRPQVVHCHLHEGALIGIVLKIFFRKKIIFDSQGSLVDELMSFGFVVPGSIKYKIFETIEKIIYKYSDRIIVSNQSNYKILNKRYKIDDNKMDILPDGVDIGFVSTTNNKEELKNKLDIPNNRKIIVYLGTLNKVEGIDTMIDIFAELKKVRNDFFILVMGYPNEKRYQAKASEMGIGDNIKFVGRLEYAKIYKYLGVGDFAISLKLPTTEGNGKILNYTALNLPIICFDHYSNRYILDKYALYLDYTKNSSENAECLNQYLDYDKTIIDDMTHGAKNRLLDKFIWGKIVEDLIKIYNK